MKGLRDVMLRYRCQGVKGEKTEGEIEKKMSEE